MPLPSCPARFAARKAAILAQLARPDDAYADASPKGAVDVGVRPLLDVINGIDGFVTTSSCAGRAAVFLEGRRGQQRSGSRPDTMEDESRAPATTTAASAGGKGGGGKWLFVSHDPLVPSPEDGGDSLVPYQAYRATDWASAFGLKDDRGSVHGDDDNADPSLRLVHLKFEPMILHVLTASLAHAQLLLRCAAAAGFRESGAVGIHATGASGSGSGRGSDQEETPLPIVAVRSMGLGFSSVIGMVRDDDDDDNDDNDAEVRCVVSPDYLAQMVRIIDERFAVNRQRTERFRVALVDAVEQETNGGGGSSTRRKDDNWENAKARRARKRAEGLRHQAALRASKTEEAEEAQEGEALVGFA